MSVAPRGSGGAVSLSWTPVPGALSYDVIAGDLQQIKVFPSMLSLGQVTVLAAGMQRTTLDLEEGVLPPSPGLCVFYLIQSHQPVGASGYGTESAPRPSEPSMATEGAGANGERRTR